MSAFYKSVLKQEGGQDALNKSLAEFEKYLKQNEKHVGGERDILLLNFRVSVCGDHREG